VFEPGARYSKIAAGYAHNLALKSDGSVVAWGNNVYGESTVPVVAQGGVVAIATGWRHNLVLKGDGSVVAWGLSDYGQSTVPVVAQGGVVAVAAGTYHSLALKSDGSVVAWGSDDYGQSTMPVVAQSGVVAIAAGSYHSVALKSDGSVVAWGLNNFGQSTMPVLAQSGVVAIAAGNYHSLALKSDGSVVAWGASTVPAGLGGVVAVAAGTYHSLALKSDGSVVAWATTEPSFSSNERGQSTVPAGLGGVVAVAAGSYHSLALKSDGSVVAWGSNGSGQSTVPAGLSGVVAIASDNHNLALKSDGSVVAWGRNNYGESTVPVVAQGGVVAIVAGYDRSLALKSDGSVVAWGRNDYGQSTVPVVAQDGVVAIGAGVFHNLALKSDGSVVAWGGNCCGLSTVPVEAQGGVVAIAAGSYHSLALKSDGSVVVWGSNLDGQNTVPAGLGGVVAIASDVHNLALKSDGTVVAWGYNDAGQVTGTPLVVSPYTAIASPVTLGGHMLSGVVAIEAGAYHSLALKSDGKVVAWGDNYFGQSTVPVVAQGGVVAIAAGGLRNLALVSTTPLTPAIVTPPVDQTVNAGQNASFNVTATGTLPMSYQWQFNGVPIAGATSATLALNNVQPRNAGRYSVRVVNAVGSAVSRTATLAILADPANGTPSTPVATPSAPPKDASHDSLVVVTHGWQPTELLFPDVRWIDDMATTIRQKLVGQANWQVRAIDWKELAFWPEPEVPLFYAKIIGNLLGRQVGSQAWSRVHLIGHSAGSAMIQEAARRIKIASPTTTVHTTFLDPYFGVLYYENRQLYGQDADWSDAYFARDISGPFTSAVPHSHSVDVTSLDPEPSRSPLHYFRLHGWPYDFYMRTVTNGFSTAQGDTSLGYGFPLSMEGGGWANRGSFPVGNTPVVLSGVPPITSPTDLPANTRLELNLTKLPVSGGNYTVSTPATAQINGDLFQFQNGGSLTPQSVRDSVGSTTGRAVQSLVPASVPVLEPAWVSIGVTVTNLVNYVKFDASFTSAAGAQGLFSVYWGTNLLGALDERAADTGLQTYRFLLPEAYTNGTYSLGFRLDAYTTTPSSLTLTNVMTGFIGITNPPALSVAPSATNGPAQITLTGATGFYSLLQSSTDLTNWISIATLVNSNGLVQFSDPGSTNQTRRYYRAVVP